jgi:putative tryptophan/tyrosine transport system substrate-binding protein
MRATTFITVVIMLLAGTVLVGPLAGEAQPAASVPRIGFLNTASLSDPRVLPFLHAFQQGLRELGYVEGQNIAIEFRWAEGSTTGSPASQSSWSVSR